jgi:hypothetical protein
MITSSNNKQKQEHLQEVRHPRKDSIKYRKRKQEEQEVEQQLKEELQKLNDSKQI